MKVLSIGSTEFQAQVQTINHNQTWELAQAHNSEEVEDHVVAGAFQAVLIDLDDCECLSRDLLAPILLLKPPYVTIGFSTEEIGVRHRPFFTGVIDVCFRKTNAADLLKMQCNSVIRLVNGHKTPIIQVSDVSLNVDTQMVTVLGRPLGLNNREYQLLELLFTNTDRIISVERFFNQVYGHQDPPSTKILDVLICKIRRKLRIAGLSKDIIETRWGQGYSVTQERQPPVQRVA